MGNYSNKNAANVLNNVNACIAELEDAMKNGTKDYNRIRSLGYSGTKAFNMRAVCTELSIFDWWKETLSLSQLKAMRSFITTAMKLGFNGYVCFKVGASGCANGMWAETAESTDGYSPKDSDTLYHSFVAGENYFDCKINGKWMHKGDDYKHNLSDVKKFIVEHRQ